MTKYFIESPDGRWLTDPDRWLEGTGAFTTDPFRAWSFEYRGGCMSCDKNSLKHRLRRFQEKEGVLKDFRITKQEFAEDGDTHISQISQMFNRVRYRAPVDGTIDQLINIS